MKNLICFFVLFSSIVMYSQEDAWIYFKDKPNATTDLANPLTILSQRALDRRTNQGIALDVSDVPINSNYFTQIQNSVGITIKAKSKWLNCLHIRGSQANINALKSLSFVQKVVYADKFLNSNNGKIKQKSKFNKINKTLETAVNYSYGNSANQVEMLNGHLLHQMNFTGSGKIIAVFDGGFPTVNTAQTFKRLRDNNKILGGYNFVAKSNNFYSGDFHGTAVLSLIGGYTEGQLIGTAPDANYYLFITEDSDSENPVEESNWVEAAEEADRLGVDIITSSLGYFDFDDSTYNHTYQSLAVNEAFASRGANIAFTKGIVVLSSSGNGGASSQPYTVVPAEAKNVIAVGAVQANKLYASFSSIGPNFNGQVKPDVTAQGDRPYTFAGSSINNAGSGTSYSCPIVAGMVACLWQGLPNKTAKQIKELIIQASDNFAEPPAKSRPQFGYGIPDFNLALSKGLSTNSFEKADFVVYPNPTSDNIEIQSSKDFVKINVEVFSILGQKVLEQNVSSKSPKLSLKQLQKGVYFYKISNNETVSTGKIVKE